MTLELRNLIYRALIEAGSVHKRYYGAQGAVLESKFGGDSAGDALTKADQESELVLRKLFSEYCPDFNFLGEEFGGAYNGNGKLVVVDPLDGTKNFIDKIPNFGTIIGVYEQGVNIAGGFSSTLKENYFLATLDTGFEADVTDDNLKDQQKKIYVGGGLSSDIQLDQELREEMTALVKESFPQFELSKEGAAISIAEVFYGRCPIVFWTSLALHDISPVPLFSELTEIPATDHRGNSYGTLEPVKEIKKYQTMNQDALYSHPILVCHPQHQQKMLKILERFYSELDAKQKKGMDFIIGDY